ncbi:hypothetical protein [Reichenbachiella sp.]|uniref:hypothetical protein n=1 Tax=Reichenbachiella sp. TaxID=2184521 RepID=UPI003B5A3C7F
MRIIIAIFGLLLASSTLNAHTPRAIEKPNSTRIIVVKKSKPYKRKVWIRGHYVKTRRGKIWIKGHWKWV